MFELIGIIASILIVISSLSKTTTFKGTIWFRSINMLGNAFFTIYGILTNSLSVIVCNGCMIFISIFYLIKEIKDYKKKECINNQLKENQP